MSDFLVSLARRSAGLAPMIRARAPLPPVVADAAGDSVAEVVTPVRQVTDSPAPVVAPSVMAPSLVLPLPSVPATVAPLTAAAPAGPIVQRVPVAVASAPASPVSSARAVESSPVAPVRQAIRIEPATPERVVVPGVPAAIVTERPMTPRIEARSAEIIPATVVRGRSSDEVPRVEQTREIVKEETHIIDRTVDGAERAVEVPLTRIEPAPPAQAPAPAVVARAEPVAAPERVVHVRIGAIEIHGSEPAPVAAPAAPSAPAPNAQFSGGFAEFAQLRSYAPWQW